MARLGTDFNFIIAGDLGSVLNLQEPNADSQSPLGITLQDTSKVDGLNATRYAITTSRYSYNYSVDGVTRQLGIGALLTHVLISLVHTVLVVWYGWKRPDLESIYDLVVLAIKSSTSISISDENISTSSVVRKKQNITIKVQG